MFKTRKSSITVLAITKAWSLRFSVAIHKKGMNGQTDQSVKISSYRDAELEICYLKEGSTLNYLLKCSKGHSNNLFGN